MSSSRKKKPLIIVAVIVLIAVIVYFNLQSQREKAIKVTIEKAETHDLTSKISASGEVKPKKSVNISSQIMGRIIKIGVVEGQIVKAGDFLLKVESTQYEANAERDRAYIRSLNAELIKAEAKFKNDENIYNRQKDLFAKQLVSRENMEAAKAQYDISYATMDAIAFQIKQAQASLKSTLDMIEKTVYVAPIDGIISSLLVEEGETAMVGTMNFQGTILMTIADLSIMEVEVEVDETDVVNLALSQTAEVTVDAFPDLTIKGEVTEIGSSALQTGSTADESRDFKVVITLIAPPENLKPGLSASADIITAVSKGTLAVPISAIVLKEDDDNNGQTEGLYIVQEDNRVKFVPVTKGIFGDLMIEVLSGLDAGQTVVIGPYSALRTLADDVLVKPEEKKETG